MNVVTSKRNYTFALNVGAGAKGRRQTAYRLTLSYPEQEAKAQQD
ncbi:forms the bulk of type IV secretion complex that spans outer membrane and periplasm (VirB9) [Vibrio astriarenae]|nr:forms the bulk of type IV secretion complex that spans outer membrane and periplasm (VirB9) [Vibrio sp. C7]